MPPQRAPAPRVILVAMPFMSLDLAPLSVGVLEAQLRRAGVVCDSVFLGFQFAEWIGVDNYNRLALEGNKLGELVFADALYGGPIVDTPEQIFHEATRRWHGWDDESERVFSEFKAIANAYIDGLVGAVPWGTYDLVGFSSTFRQNVASLALGRRIKERFPATRVAFGGSNWQAEMGEALHEGFEWVDYAALGEADELIVDLARAAAGVGDARSIPGIAGRDEHGRFVNPVPERFTDMNELPTPEYSNWIAQREAHPLAAESSPQLTFESSRGCWWGARSHCTFCGLNGAGMASRVRSGRLVHDDVQLLRDRHGINEFLAADTILPMAHFHDLLPALAEADPRFDIFYETKVNLSLAKVKALSDAGVRRVQPGIESLSDNVLSLLRKGTTAMQNVQFLRWCAEFSIEPDWLILIGIPGETDEDYRRTGELAAALRHLPPPERVQGIAIHRFSPLHQDPEGHGFRNMRFDPLYRLMYPFSDDMLERVAYHFVADHDLDFDTAAVRQAIDRLDVWIDDPRPGSLTMRRHDEEIVVTSHTPEGRPVEVRYSGWRADLLEAMDRIRSRRKISDLLPDVAGAAIDAFLAESVAAGHVLAGPQGYLTLPVWTPARTDVGPVARKRSLLPVVAD